ncbi:transmembrane prolyl 4-hydroxylase-like [Actinia tenebrosa]|uniref:Transmembrane prolyl 4-hydroxylase-like n=1 Tax=Actinia tenebrosa TaxID=6105 RepID=A0A6P8HTR1_ACTTE|nr:transmembrane prolyl 4-hydroxylase-like [Actinia tenebrosa]
MAEHRLVRIDGVKVGHVQEVELEEGRRYTMITKAMKPVMFEIPNFLSNDECDYIIKLANLTGLEQSVAGFIKDRYDGELDQQINAVDETRPAEGPDELRAEKFDWWDENNDSVIDEQEIIRFARNYDKLYLKKQEIQDMLKRIGFQGYKKCEITRKEFEERGIKKILAYMHFLKDKHPLHRHRLSDQTWLYRNMSDPVLSRLINRVTKLTRLPRKFVRASEAIQVVRYQQNGHYHAHMDSTPIRNDELYCCHQNLYKKKECKLCRFITILYYLNDVESGGETAFPIADQDTRPLDKRLVDPGISHDELNLTEHCQNASLVLPPKKGTAVMWYNHYVDTDSGYLGDLDEFSVHGGCDIKKGMKWIANNWINAPVAKTAHIKSIYDVDDH